jgi:mannitol/fructose-specific phosphotransferase system IIA component (Ntr-type)
MKSLLNALQEGRLIELPDTDKNKNLEYLATLIEAIPDFRSGFDFTGAIMARERAANTAIGAGWACPHGRVRGAGQLSSAIDWSAPDGKPVHIVIMHYIPDSEKNTYLKEISTLARVIQKDKLKYEFAAEADLGTVRHRMLDLVTAALETAVPDVKARMIRLEARQAAVAQALPPELLSSVELVPLSIVIAPGTRPVVLSQNQALTTGIETSGTLPALLASKLPFDLAGYRILIHSVTPYLPDRFLYGCIAVRLGNANAGQK